MACSETYDDELLEHAESFINAVREPVIVLDHYLRVISASRYFYEVFKIKPDETLGRLIYDLGDRQWDIPELRQLLETLLPQKRILDDYELEHEFADLGRRTMLFNAREIQRKSGQERLILLAIEDITERKQTEKARKEQSRTLNERNKELSCLYGISRLVEDQGNSLDDILQGTVNLLPSSWQYPEAACARIKFEDRVYVTGNFRETSRRQAQDIISEKEVAGGVEIFYLEEKIPGHEGTFIKEERKLLGAVAERLGHIIGRVRAQTRLQQSEQKFRAIFHGSNDAAFIHSLYGQFLEVNQVACNRLGYSREELLLMTPMDLDVDEFASIGRQRTKDVDQHGSLVFESVHRCKDGSTIAVEISSRKIDYEGKNCILSIARDITERKQAEAVLKENKDRYRLLAENVNDVIYTLDMNLNYTYISPSAKFLLGYEPSEILKKSASEVLTPHSLGLATKILSEVMELVQSEHSEISVRRTFELEQIRKDGTIVPTEENVSLIRDEKQQPVGILGISRDITERKQAEETIRQMAYHDSLTGLPNRKLFSDRVGLALAQAGRDQNNVAVIMLDLDNFKNINDSLGHDAGDLLLKTAAGRLQAAMRKSDTVARFGGDEFMLLLPGLKGIRDATPVARKIVNSFRRPFLINTRKLVVTTSIGIAVYPDDGTDEATLLKKADIAMYQAKQAGRDRYQVFATGTEQYISTF
ncbi:MAG: PAS domain S-box protein [Desulfosudaceae bacterium]